MNKLLGGTGLAALAIVALSHPASATTAAFGSFGFTPVGTVTTSNGDVNKATTSVTFPPTMFINTINSTYLGQPTNLVLTLGEAVSLAPSMLSIGALNVVNLISEKVTVGSYNFDYTKEETTALTDGTIGLLFNGTFADLSGKLMFGSSDLSLSLTQTTTGAAVNGSFSVDTPLSVPVSVPEPTSLALIGSGLLGLELIRRRRAY